MAVINSINQAIPSIINAGQKNYIDFEGIEGSQSFKDILNTAIRSTEKAGQVEDYNRDLLLSGDVNNLHDIPIALTESELTLNLAIQVRNKVLDAYNEVMRMQV